MIMTYLGRDPRFMGGTWTLDMYTRMKAGVFILGKRVQISLWVGILTLDMYTVDDAFHLQEESLDNLGW